MAQLAASQFNSIGIVLQCCWANAMSTLSAYRKQKDKAYYDLREKLLLIRAMMKRLKCYDPEAEGNCLTYDETVTMVDYMARELGICGSYLNIEETSVSCCSTPDSSIFNS